MAAPLIIDCSLRPADVASAWDAMRRSRDARLRASDWTQLPDSPLDGPQRAAWTVYREALRDLPVNTLSPFAPSWPVPPG